MLTRLRQVCDHPALVTLAQSDDSDNNSPVQNIEELISKYRANSGNENYARDVVKNIDEKKDDILECPICLDELNGTGILLPCLHRTCKDCILDIIESKESKGEKPECPVCRCEIRESDLLQITTQTTLDNSESRIVFKPLGYVMSTKVHAMLSILKSNCIGHKTIIYSQWSTMLNLLESVLQDNGIKFVRLDGSMSRYQRY
jgi:DNA repair protein RAD5